MNSAFRRSPYRWQYRLKHPGKEVLDFCRNLKYCVQRIRKGYCDADVWDIYGWFLSVMPDMLQELKENHVAYPDPLDGETASTEEEGIRRWESILDRMIFLFREADEDTCTKKNPYDKRYWKASKEFKKRYGPRGEKLRTEKDREERERTGRNRMYTMHDVPEYKDISSKWLHAELRLDRYRAGCRKEALELFNRYFDHLWD